MEIHFVIRCTSTTKWNITAKVFIKLISIENMYLDIPNIRSHNLTICVFLFQRFLDHLAELVDATHILCGSRITHENLEHAKRLLTSFVDNFEIHYGESNAVFNVHLLRHLADCVKFNGPLFTYSNYNFEDHIGRLVAMQKGTQISERYILEKNVFHQIVKSPIALTFYNEIESKQSYSICHKINGSLLIGKAKKFSTLNEQEISIITNELNISIDTQIYEYNSILLSGNTFYETVDKNITKRTNDSFVFNESVKRFASIRSIFVVNNEIFFLVNEEFEMVFDMKNKCKFVIHLKKNDRYKQTVVRASSIGFKFALVEFDSIITCSKFPNMFERD